MRRWGFPRVFNQYSLMRAPIFSYRVPIILYGIQKWPLQLWVSGLFLLEWRDNLIGLQYLGSPDRAPSCFPSQIALYWAVRLIYWVLWGLAIFPLILMRSETDFSNDFCNQTDGQKKLVSSVERTSWSGGFWYRFYITHVNVFRKLRLCGPYCIYNPNVYSIHAAIYTAIHTAIYSMNKNKQALIMAASTAVCRELEDETASTGS